MLENPWSAVGNPPLLSALRARASALKASRIGYLGIHHLLLSNLTTDHRHDRSSRLSVCSNTTNCCSTDGDRLHRCCHIANSFRLTTDDPYTSQWAGTCPQKLPLSIRGSPPNTWSLGPTRIHTLNDSRFSTARDYVQQTDRHTNHGTSVTIGRIFALGPCDEA